VGLSYVLDGDNGLSLCHHLYRGNMADAEQFPEALRRIVTLLERNQIAADTVTLVLDKGSAALANTLELEKAAWDGFRRCLGARRRPSYALRSNSLSSAAANRVCRLPRASPWFTATSTSAW